MRTIVASLLTAALLAAVFAVPAHALWPAGRFTCMNLDEGTHQGTLPHAIADGEGGFWVTFLQFMTPYNSSPFVRRVNADGDMPWAPVMLDDTFGDQRPTNIVADGQGGVFVSFDLYLDPYFVSLYVQRVGPTGALLWGTAGTTVVGTQEPLGTPALVDDGSGGCFVAWITSGGWVRAQHVLADGQLDPAWPSGGLFVSDDHGCSGVKMVSAGPGACLVSYCHSRSYGAVLEVIAARVLSNGTLDSSWPAGGLVLPVGGKEQNASALADGAGGVFLAWQRDVSTAVYDICAQHVLANGTVDSRWPSTGRVVCAAAGSQSSAQLVSDLAGGIVVGWNDERAGNRDIYAARVLADGTLDPAWPVNGRAVCTADSAQWLLAMASDGRGGAGLLWSDSRWHSLQDGAVMARVGSNGVLDTAYPANGRLLAMFSYALGSASLVPDDAGGYFPSFAAGQGVQALHVDRWGLAGAQPVITSVVDTPNDEGGFVNVTFARSWLDTMLTLPLSAYRIWREVPAATAAAREAGGERTLAFDDEHGSGALAAPGDLRVTSDAAGEPHYWEMYTAIPCYGTPTYTVTVGTMCDSIVGIPTGTSFMIEGRASDGVRAWVSPPARGGSRDNIEPAAPTQLVGTYSAGAVTLRWNRSASPDVKFYEVRRTKYGGPPGGWPYEELGFVTDTTWSGTIPEPSWFTVCPFDIHMLLGSCANVMPTGTLETPATPLAFSLEPPSPNPSRGKLVLAFTLPSAGHVSFAIHDAQGRLVRSLLDGMRPAGSHWVPWDGRAADGRTAPPGVYFARLTCDGHTATRRLLRLP